ncbi:MAG: outer membrane protein assembly factor BamD [Syntrophales bacterium]
MYRKKFFLFILVLMFSLSGCAWWKRTDTTKNTPEALYQRGYGYYQKGTYYKAIEFFERVKEEYPLSQLAILAEIGIADAHFSQGKYTEAEMAYNDFINLHPTNENLPYMIYQLGMCHYKQMASIDRDQTETLKARKEFERLMSRFPGSKFSFLAEKKLRDCEKKIGEHEFYVGCFYFKMKKYGAALKRFEIITSDYPNLGLDYKVSYFISETKKHLAEKETQGKSSDVPPPTQNPWSFW